MSLLLCRERWTWLLTAFFTSFVFSQDRLQFCAACHGPDGNSTTAGVPSIAGQPKLFLENQLVLFREGVRPPSEQKQPLVEGLSDKEIVQLAQHFASLPPKPSVGPVDKLLLERGAGLATRLRCGICHLADFRGQNQVPRLAGQREEYLVSEMRAYRESKRAGADTIMAAALYGISDADIKALGHFLSRSPSNSSGGRGR